MYKLSLLWICIVITGLAWPALAADISISEDLVVSVQLKPGWTLHLEDPPAALVKEIARHIAHDPAATEATPEQVERVARKRLAANEAIIFHAETGTHLDIDFSPLAMKESAPASDTLRRSAQYAAQSLEGEKDVSDVVWGVFPVIITGAQDAFLLKADYKLHGLPMQHLGVVGYVPGYWFFFYGTGPGGAPAVLGEMRTILDQMVINRPG